MTDMKFCVDCKHHRDIGDFRQQIHGCAVENMFDPVDGKQVYRTCSIERLFAHSCGPEAKLFEAKDG